MSVRIIVFFSALVFAVLSLACNRHTTSSADAFNDPVAGDTVPFCQTMIPRLIKDSVELRDAYYYRINHVKRVEITDNNSRELLEIDRFGHELTEVHYIEEEIFWKNVDVYNRYGNLFSSRHVFYDDAATVGSVYVTQYNYEPDPWNLGQRVVKTDMKCIRKGGDTEKEYAYRYSYKGHLLTVESRFVNDKGTEMIYYSYTDFDKPKQQLIVSYEGGKPDTTIRVYKYDSLRREVNWAVMRNGELIEDHITEYNSSGRVSKYSSITYKPYSAYVFEYYYFDNGLVSRRVVTHADKTETERYRYAYY